MIRSGGEVARLMADLRDADPIRRDAAIAKLRIIGSRAIEPLVTLALSRESAGAREAALKALEGSEDPRVIEAALLLLDDARFTICALNVLRPWVLREPGTRILEALTALALNPTAEATARLAALDAIAQLSPALVAPLIAQAGVTPSAGPGLDDPLSALEWLSAHPTASLSDIHALVDRLRQCEQREPVSERRDHWRTARGAAHLLLATRGSTVAVYDLRETFGTTTRPLPSDFVSAVALVGDASCLESMARAWAATAGESWWRDHVANAASEIMRRRRLTGRHGAVKRIRAKWPGFV